MISTKHIIPIATALYSCLCISAVYAANPSTSTNPADALGIHLPASSNNAVSNTSTAAARWFENYDRQIATYQATDGDRAILSRPINKQKDRMDQWSNTASKIAHNYRTLAKSISSMPAVASDIKEYRDLISDWFNDAALVYEDLLQPRAPAQTMEELQHNLDEFKERSHNLAENRTNLQNMDHSLREKYQIHSP